MNNHKSYFLVNFKTLIILVFLVISTKVFANEKIGSVTDIKGSAITINAEGDEKELSVFDPIFLGEEIFVSEQSTLTIQFNDNTTVIIKELSSLSISEFENSEIRKKFKGKTNKGEILIESGSIAKASDGEMLIDVSNIQLGVRGTRLTVGITSGGNAKVALAADSFGNVGEISLKSEEQTTNLSSSEQVIEINEERKISRREQTSEEKKELKDASQTLVEVSKIDEQDLDQKLEKKLQEGKLEDANNDGIIDGADIEVVKENIKVEKKANLDFIVENSKTDNTEFLSNVLDQSDEKNIGETITKIIDVKDDLIEDVVDNLSDKENIFITSSESEEVVAVKEKMFETIVAKETPKSAEILSKVMAKSDEGTIASVITNITEKNTNEQSTLSLKVMANFSEKNPEKLEELSAKNSDQVEKLTIDAVQKASTSNEDVELIAKVVAAANDEIVNKVVEEVSKTSIEEKQNLSAKVLKAIVDTEPTKIDIIDEKIKDTLINQTIEAIKVQDESLTDIPIEDNLTEIVTDIIVKTDNTTASKIIEEVSNIDTNSNISLKVIAGISEKSSEKLTSLSETNKAEIDKLTVVAVEKAENTSSDSELIAKVISVASDELANKVVEEVSKAAVAEKQSLSVKVLKAIVDTQPEKIEIINEDLKDSLIEKAIEATKDQQEGNLIEEENLTDAVSEIIIKTDSNTAAKVIEEINDVVTDTNLSLEVISTISEKDENKLNDLSDNLEEQIQKLTEQAVQNAENTQKDSELIAKVVSVVNDDLVNIMVEEVSKISTDEKQTLSAKVLKAIVDTEPTKINIINDDVKDILIEQTIVSAKNQEEGIGIQEDENLTAIVSDIIVNTDTETAAKIIEEVNNTKTESNLSLIIISDISEKDTQKLNDLSKNNKEQIEILTEQAVLNAENTSEDSQKIANVVSVVNDELLNIMVEEVSNISTEEKQTLSAKVLKAIVDTEPSKIDVINEQIKDKMIEQTIESAKNQEEGIGIQEEDNMTDIVSDIIINTDTETAAKIIDEVNEIETISNLSLKVISGISEKDENKLDALIQNNSTQVDELTENAIQNAKNTKEDSELIAKVVSAASDDLVNKVVEEVSKISTEEKQTLSAKVLKAIVDTEPSKINVIEENIKETIIEQTVESAKDQQEGNLAEEDNITDIVAEIIVKSDKETASKLIEEVNETETDSSLSLDIISGVSQKDENKLNDLSDNIQEEIEKLAKDAVQNAENTTEDSQKIADVVAVVNDDLLNKVVEDVSETSVDEKQSLSAKVLKAIVDNKPDKIEKINAEIKETIIEQTIEATKEQQEGTNLSDTEDLTDLVAEIIVKSDNETAEQIINEVNEIETDTNLSLKVISGISVKDNEKLNILSENNQEQIDLLAENAVNKAENTEEDSQLIANIVSVVNDNLANKVVEEVNEAAQENDKETLSAKVLKAIVDTEPEKIEIISEENKKDLIESAIDAAVNQDEGSLSQEEQIDYSDLIADVIVNTDTDTASELLEEINNTETDTDISLNILNNLKEKENFNEVINEISEKSNENKNIISEIVDDAIDEAVKNEDSESIVEIINQSEGNLTSEILESVVNEANENEENNNIVNETIEEVIKEDPNKIIEVLETKEDTEELVEQIEDKIENEESISLEDFEEVFKNNVSPN